MANSSVDLPGQPLAAPLPDIADYDLANAWNYYYTCVFASEDNCSFPDMASSTGDLPGQPWAAPLSDIEGNDIANGSEDNVPFPDMVSFPNMASSNGDPTGQPLAAPPPDVADNDIANVTDDGRSFPDHMETMEEMGKLRQLPCWREFLEGTRAALGGGSARIALAHHTTTSNQVKRVPALGGSNKAWGLDTPIQAENGQWYCNVNYPAMFHTNDGFPMEYVSELHKDTKTAKGETCLEVLCFVLLARPQHVRMHVNQWQEGMVPEVRRRAENLQNALTGDGGSALPPGKKWTFQILAAYQPAIESDPPTHTSNRASRLATDYTPPKEGCEAQRDNEIDAVLRLLKPRKSYPSGQSKTFPPNVWPQLQTLLPPRGLLPWLKKHPDDYTITSEKPLQFHRGPPEPAIGGRGGSEGRPGDVGEWTVADVSAFFGELSLGHAIASIEENAVDGKLLLELCEQEMVDHLNLLPLQAKKVHINIPWQI
jgi:hypothetical protein